MLELNSAFNVVFLGNKMKQKNQRKVPAKLLVRLKSLQKYCNELLSCDPRVPQSADIIKFFHPKDQDLDPDFTKNRFAKRLFQTNNATSAHAAADCRPTEE